MSNYAAAAAAPNEFDLTPPSLIVTETLRKNYKMASISHFVGLFAPHLGLDFDVQELERDLDGTNEVMRCIPTMMGKLLNTLANDRNTNATNWMPALRRQYNRRFPNLSHSFTEYVVSDKQLTGKELLARDAQRLEIQRQQQETTTVPSASLSEILDDDEDEDNHNSMAIKVDENDNSDLPADSSMLVALEDSNPLISTPSAARLSADVTISPVSIAIEKEEPSGVEIASTEQPNALAGSSKEAMTDIVMQSEDTKIDAEAKNGDEWVIPDGDLDWIPKDIEWDQVSLEDKIDAIYQACEWHMLSPDRFRKHLKFEIDASWRLEPLGQDARESRYYYLHDHRLWIQRVLHSSTRPPPPPPLPKRRRAPAGKKSLLPSIRRKPGPKKGWRTAKLLAESGESPATTSDAVASTSSPSSPRKDRGPPKDRSRPSSSRKRHHSHDDDDDEDDDFQASPAVDASTSASTAQGQDIESPVGKRARRSSGRRETMNEEVWQEVPEEWLIVKEMVEKGAKKLKNKQEQEDDEEYAEDDGDDDNDDDDDDEEDEDDDQEGYREESLADSSILSSVDEDGERRRGGRADEEDEEGYDDDDDDAAEEQESAGASSPVKRTNGVDPAVDGTKVTSTEESQADAGGFTGFADMDELDDGLMPWEREYWAEREIIEAPEFVEWEAICTTLEEWQAFAASLANTKDKHEKKLRDAITNNIIPVVEREYADKELARLNDIATNNRKRSSRIADKESVQEEDARLQLERRDASNRNSRASRHQIASVSNHEYGIGSSNSPYSYLPSAITSESRDVRSKKREELKVAKAIASEVAQMDRARRIARDEATIANGGVVPDGWETPEELEAARLLADRGKKIAGKMEKKAKKEGEKVNLAKLKKAEKIAKKQAILLAAQQKELDAEEPWFLDCEICHRAEWNMDDGSDVISCDRCTDWQHLACHEEADLAAGRQKVDYALVDFLCSRCRADPDRVQPIRDPPPRRILTLPSTVVGASASQDDDVVVVKEKRKYKPRAPKIYLDENGEPLPAGFKPPPKVRKLKSLKGDAKLPKTPKLKTPKGGKGTPSTSADQPRPNGNGLALSSPSPVKREASSTDASTQATVSGAPAAQSADGAMDYPALLAMVKNNPTLISQLPLEYQQHFSQLLGIPLPT